MYALGKSFESSCSSVVTLIPNPSVFTHRFYIVVCESTLKYPRRWKPHKHAKWSEAVAEAGRLAIAHPGLTFTVYKSDRMIALIALIDDSIRVRKLEMKK